MNPWQAIFFGLKQIPRELTAFEIEAFFTFTATERQVIEQRRQPALRLGLALQIGFLRMSGRVLDAVRIVPAVLWRHLGEQFLIARCAPTRTEGLNMRGIFRFPIELYLEQLLPSWASPKIQLLEP